MSSANDQVSGREGPRPRACAAARSSSWRHKFLCEIRKFTAQLLLIAFVFGAVAGSMALGVFLARYVGPYYLGMAIPEDVMRHSQHVVLVSIAGMLFALGAISLHAGGLGNEDWDADRLGREL